MQSTSGLRSLLLSTLGTSGHTQTAEHDLYEELMAHKHVLLNVFDVGRRSPEQQRAIESGKITVHGEAMAVNPDFSRQAIFISQQLNCSEQHAAELLHDVMSSHPNLVGERCVEATILEHHTRRRQVAECLKYVFEGALASQSPDAPPLYHRLELFVRQQLVSQQGTALSLAEKLLNEVDKLGEMLSKVSAERQNAGSVTVAPTPAVHGAHLGHDMLTAIRDSLEYERSTLAIVLFLIGRLGYLSCGEICRMVDWLRSNPRHPVIFYYLPTILVAFDVVNPQSSSAQSRKRLISDTNFIAQMNNKLKIDTPWAEPGLKSTVLLKWTVFLIEVRHRDASWEEKEGFKAEQLETNIWNAVQGDCFPYLTNLVLRLRGERDLPVPASLALVVMPEHDIPGEIPSDDFVPSILDVLEVVMHCLISRASSELRKIKQRQEDLLLADARADRSRAWRSSSTSQPTARHPSGGESGNDKPRSLRNDVACMFSFMGLLYSSLPPDRALPYWGASGPTKLDTDHLESATRRLPSFLQWAIWSTQSNDLVMLTALYDMLTGLANGERCSELAYNFLVRGSGDGVGGDTSPSIPSQVGPGPTVSWQSMFNQLESWAAAGSTRSNQPPPSLVGGATGSLTSGGAWQGQGVHQQQVHLSQSRLSLTQQDVLVAQAFLHLLSTVVTNSVPVRINICGHARFRAIPTLISLIPLSIPLELKGVLFDTLSSFCQPGAGVPGLEICRSVWAFMERLEIINIRTGLTAGPTVASVKGVEVELEEVESAYKVYPATIAFVKLLSTLMHTPKSIPLRDAFSHQPIGTIPDGLGHPYRTPGIGPYTSFVVDNVFSNISRREYLRPSDRWRMNDACLSFIERCLASFDSESLAANFEAVSAKSGNAMQMLLHPGYDIMKRLLTQSSLQSSILSYIVEGTDGFDKGLADEQPFFRRMIVRLLRIVHRALEIQDIFLDVLIPLLADMDDKSYLGDLRPASYYVKLTQALFFTPEYISALATYVAYPAYLEIRILAVKILSLLATPSTVHQLAVVVDRSPDSVRILNGFLSILDVETWVDVESAEIVTDQCTGAGAPDQDIPTDAVAQATKIILLDFLTQNTGTDLPYPNIAHLMLFGQLEVRDSIRDPGALDGQRGCIHALLDMVNRGVPNSTARTDVWEDPLFVILPGLAERCYGVIHQLCRHPSTTEFVTRYLRSREDFFTRHLRAIPCLVPAASQNASVEVVYHDGSRVRTSVSALCSFLRLRSCILDLVALELHMLVSKGQQKGVADFLAVLFDYEGNALGTEVPYPANDIFKPFQEVGQAQSKIIELLQRLDFDWSDGLAVRPVELQFLSQLNLLSCLRTDRVGCEVIDQAALLTLLSDARHALHTHGHIVTSTHADTLSEEMTYILQSCAVENHRRQVQHAVAVGFEAWADVLNIALIQCFSRMPIDRQENILLDLLQVLPSSLQSTHISQSATTILAESILITIIKLREVLLEAHGAQHQDANLLPPERLHSFLRSLLSCIVHPSCSQLVRGNLYASFVHYLHLATRSDPVASPDYILMDNGEDLRISFAERQTHPDSSLVAGTVELIRPFYERLTGIISRDASDGAEVWRTVALLLLDSLVQFCHQRFNILTSISRPGHLSGFVNSLDDIDLRLQAVLKPECDDLNVLYAYEAKMSLFNRIVQSKAGAEQLLESRILAVLARCDFLDARPETEYDLTGGHSDYVPPIIHRYHQLLMPALQLVSGMMLVLGPEHSSAVNQIRDFLRSHIDILILLLRSNTGALSSYAVREIHFLVSTCAVVVQQVSCTELCSTSGYGSLHSAILNFAARFLGSLDENISGKNMSDHWFLVLQAVLSYIGMSSDMLDSKHFFVPTLSTTQGNTAVIHMNMSAPSLGDAMKALDVLSSEVLHIPLQQHNSAMEEV